MTTAERINSIAETVQRLRIQEVKKYLGTLERRIEAAQGQERAIWEARLAGAESVWATMTAPLEDLLPEE